MPVIPPGYMNMIISGSTDGTDRPWAIAHGYSVEDMGNDDFVEIAGNIAASDYRTNSATETLWVSVDFVFGTSDPSAPVHFVLPIGESGDGGEAAGPQTAYLVRKTTTLGGRKGRGRTYFPGVTEVANGVGGIINEGDGTLRESLEGFWPGIVTGLPTGSADPYLLHEDDTPPTSVGAWTLDTRIATQRRRLRK